MRGVRPYTDIKRNGVCIPVKKHKFLVITVDEKLKIIAHIKQVNHKCSKTMIILNVLSHITFSADRQVFTRF